MSVKRIGLILLIFAVLFSFYYMYIEGAIKSQKVDVVKNRQHLTIRVDSSFSDNEKMQIFNAADKWGKATKRYITFDIIIVEIKESEFDTWKEDSSPTIYNATNFLKWPFHVAQVMENFTGTLGFTLIDSADVFVLKTNYYFESMIAHELGHIVVGSYHSPSERDLMYPTINGYKEISNNDVSVALLKVELWNKQ